jgi:hypothetical protein
MHRTMATTVWFRCSTTPFCCDEYGAVSCRSTLRSAQYHPILMEETPRVIGAQGLQLESGLHLDGHLEVLDHRRRLILAGQEHKPHEAAHVIHQQQEVVVATACRRQDKAADVPMN